MAPTSVIEAIRGYLRALSADGLEPAFGVLFGSHARDRAEEWSDIDLVVVSARFDGERDLDTVLQLWRTAARVDSRIEPVACGFDEWSTDDSRAILEVARREGQIISAACLAGSDPNE